MRISSFVTAFLCLGLLGIGCDNGNNSKSDITFKSVVFEDDFNTGGMPDESKWQYDIGTGAEIFGQPGWGNNELQYYTNRSENIRIEDGMLKITALEENYEGSGYTSAKILTKGIFETTFGRFEARMQLPFGQGLWPAFWLLGDDSDGTEVWPEIGEIDIMEYRGQEPIVVHGTIHGPGYSAAQGVTDSYTITNGRFDTEFHVFAIEWGPNFIDFYVDETLYNRITPDNVGNNEWVFNDNSFYIIINVAVGGNYVGSPNASTRFPQTMLVDYVRVYGMD